MNKLPACTWDVEVEVRKTGAMGLFEWRTFRVRAKNEEFARMYAAEDAEMQGYETRFSKQAIRMDDHAQTNS